MRCPAVHVKYTIVAASCEVNVLRVLRLLKFVVQKVLSTCEKKVERCCFKYHQTTIFRCEILRAQLPFDHMSSLLLRCTKECLEMGDNFANNLRDSDYSNGK